MFSPIRKLFTPEKSAYRPRAERFARPALEGLEERVTPAGLPLAPRQLLSQLAQLVHSLQAPAARPALPPLSTVLARLPVQQLQQLVAKLPAASLLPAINQLPLDGLRQAVARLSQDLAQQLAARLTGPALTQALAQLPVATLQQALDRLQSQVQALGSNAQLPPLPALPSATTLAAWLSPLTPAQLQGLAANLPTGQLQQALSRLNLPTLQQAIARLPLGQLQRVAASLPLARLQSLVARAQGPALRAALNQVSQRLTQALDTIFAQLGAAGPARLLSAVDQLFGRLPH